MNSEATHSKAILNEAAFELLFKAHFQGLCFFAQKYIKDFETAREIVHDAFINLWEKRETIDLSKPVKSYLTTSVYNRSLNYLRDNKKFNREILTFENLLHEKIFDLPDQLVEKEIEQKIKFAIDELPEKCKQVFIMNRFENMKYQEIADKLQISIKTVETQISKALQHMRSRLAEYMTVLLLIMVNG